MSMPKHAFALVLGLLLAGQGSASAGQSHGANQGGGHSGGGDHSSHGENYWLERAAKTNMRPPEPTRTDVVNSILSGADARSALVQDTYQPFLVRPTSPGEVIFPPQNFSGSYVLSIGPTVPGLLELGASAGDNQISPSGSAAPSSIIVPLGPRLGEVY